MRARSSADLDAPLRTVHGHPGLRCGGSLTRSPTQDAAQQVADVVDVRPRQRRVERHGNRRVANALGFGKVAAPRESEQSSFGRLSSRVALALC